MRRSALALVVFAVAASTVITVDVVSGQWPTGPHREGTSLTGRILNEVGRPLAGTRVEIGGDALTTDAQGRFATPTRAEPHLVTFRAEGHLPRTQAVEPGESTEVRLTSRGEETVSIRFGGDTMFGRRFYDQNDDGDRRDGLLADGASAADHAALLAHVRPLLEDADLTVVNLETPLVDRPWVDPTRPRPARFHPTKEYVFASAPPSAQALGQAGIDVVSLGNNHVNDALGEGLITTLQVLDQAGVPHFGAGRTVDEAWAPAFVERKDQVVAFLGCTTITGTEHAIPYVANDRQGGAAQCTAERLDREVRSARARADIVVAMIHGGEEYEARQTDLVRQLSLVARDAGATVVPNGHPHVLGSVSLDGSAVVAESLGNLLFDQTVWPTFLSYLLRVDVRAGQPVLATVDPLFIEDYVPRPAVGLLADAAARKAAPPETGTALRLQPPGAIITPGDPSGTTTVDHPVPAGTLARLAPGWWVDSAPRTDRSIVFGEDLLWTGSFEDMDTDPATSGAHAWSLSSTATTTPVAACAGSAVGVELSRSPVSTLDVIATPEHRQLVSPGDVLSLVVDVRDASPGSTVELSWYPDTRGASTTTTSAPIPAGNHPSDSCRRVRIDATVPDGIVAAQPVVRLAPPLDVHRGARLAIDNMQLIAWAAPGESGPRFDTIESRDDVLLTITAATIDTNGGPFTSPVTSSR
ncbi:MAG TPA: CapA family protein [Egibacteraceae bacterium]|nr:CapA family protein [Egibacteraceae bacterium]